MKTKRKKKKFDIKWKKRKIWKIQVDIFGHYCCCCCWITGNLSLYVKTGPEISKSINIRIYLYLYLCVRIQNHWYQNWHIFIGYGCVCVSVLHQNCIWCTCYWCVYVCLVCGLCRSINWYIWMTITSCKDKKYRRDSLMMN